MRFSLVERGKLVTSNGDGRLLIAAILVVITSAIAIYELFGWLGAGVWTNINLGSVFGYQVESPKAESWKGLLLLADWLAAVPLILPFALGTGGIFALMLWRKWKDERKPGSESVAILAATWLAAIAAGLSSVAAFRQEKATFTNSLYTKQVDTFASLLSKADNLRKYLDILSARTLHNTEKTVASFSDAEIVTFFTQVRDADRLISPLVEELDQIANQVFLVTPDPMQRQVHRLKQQFDNFRNQTKDISDLLEKEKAAFEHKRYPSNLRAVFQDISRRLDYTDSLFLILEKEIDRCAFGLFVEGRFLSVSSLRDCTLTFPKDPD